MKVTEKSLRWYETWAVLLVSLSALTTAWCAFQSNLWTGAQDFSLAESEDWEVQASREYLIENQHRMFDGLVTLSIIEALAESRNETIDFLVSRVKPELKVVIEEWLATDPVNNKSAPPHPLAMPRYKELILTPLTNKVTDLKKKSGTSKLTAQNASTISDSYVLLTVLLALVLFFGGIASTLHSMLMRRVVLWCATIMFLISAVKMLMLPVMFD